MEEPKDIGVIYSKELRSAIERIGALSAEMQPPSYFSLYNDIIPGLYNHLLDYEISQDTYKLVWQMLNRIVTAGNFVWFKQYWSWAVQYEMFKFQGDKRAETGNHFYFFHVMVGALLCFNKRYEWLSYILFFTTQLPERFGLVPNTYQEIVDVAETIYYQNEQPFFFESNFQFHGLSSGVRNDSIIVGAAYDYLALLIIRLWSLDYNVSYAEPKNLPQMDSVNIDRNYALGKVSGMLRRKVQGWYAKDRLDKVELRYIPSETDVIQLLDTFSDNIKRYNSEIFEQAELDSEKLGNLKSDLQESAIRHANYFPTAIDSGLIVNDAVICDYRLEIKYNMDKSLLIPGKSASYTNLPDVLIKNLVYQAIEHYERFFINELPLYTYKVCYDDIDKAIEKLSLSAEYVILSFGEYINERFKIDLPIVNIESRMACIIIMRKDQLPFTEYVAKKLVEKDMDDILPDGVHLYSNVEYLTKDCMLKLVQYIRVYSSKEPMQYIRLNVDHFSIIEKFDLDKILPVG